MTETTERILQMIQQSPTAFHAVETVRNELKERGFILSGCRRKNRAVSALPQVTATRHASS